MPPERIFGGLDGYKKAIDVDSDLVVIATPPGYKPQQFEYAVNKGRHIFMEKPVASDAVGVRRVLDCGRRIQEKESDGRDRICNVGTSRGTWKRLSEFMTVRSVTSSPSASTGTAAASGIATGHPEQTEMAFQTNNWYHFNWLSGDQICEQHIHNLDVGCWVKGAYPVECNGMGGREMREGWRRDEVADL